MGGSFAPWVGALIPDINQPILIVDEAGREQEVVTRLARVGYDNALGFLQGGIAAWQQAGHDLDTIESISAEEAAARLAADPAAILLDVRKKSENYSEHVLGAQNLPLDVVNEEMAALNPDKTYYIHCAGGYRSMVFASILKARGFDKLIDVQGGFKAIKDSEKFEVSPYLCPSTML